MFSFEAGPRSLDSGAFEVVEETERLVRNGEVLKAIGDTRGRHGKTRARLEVIAARRRGESCVGGIAVYVVVY